MTMTANRETEGSQKVKVGITYGPVTASVVEDAGHLRGFHSHLGTLLDKIEAEELAKRESAQQES